MVQPNPTVLACQKSLPGASLLSGRSQPPDGQPSHPRPHEAQLSPCSYSAQESACRATALSPDGEPFHVSGPWAVTVPAWPSAALLEWARGSPPMACGGFAPAAPPVALACCPFPPPGCRLRIL